MLKNVGYFFWVYATFQESEKAHVNFIFILKNYSLTHFVLPFSSTLRGYSTLIVREIKLFLKIFFSVNTTYNEIWGSNHFCGATNFEEHQIWGSGKLSEAINFEGCQILENIPFSGATQFRERQIVGSGKFRGASNFGGQQILIERNWKSFKHRSLRQL